MTTSTILNVPVMMPMPPRNEKLWQAVQSRDATQDGKFVYAVRSTSVYCRPSCSSRRPRRENVEFYPTPMAAEEAGFRACLRCRPRLQGTRPQVAAVRRMCRFIEQHLEETLTLAKLAKTFGQSPFHLQRTFKAVLKITPREYADSCRVNSFKRNLSEGQSVTRAMYEAGYGSSSRLYERASKQLGMTPDKYRRGAIAVPIRFTSVASRLGRMLVAATEKGICAVRFGNSDAELEQGLRREYPFAARRREDDSLKTWTEQLLLQLDGHGLDRSLPLDIQATAFQRKVWSHLQQIPRGETESYREVAREIGKPTAARAVARACATNPVAVAIPCHRVIREDGSLGGYRWGLKRKQALLAMESGAAT